MMGLIARGRGLDSCPKMLGFFLLMIIRWCSMGFFHVYQGFVMIFIFHLPGIEDERINGVFHGNHDHKTERFSKKIWSFMVIIATSYTYGEVSVSTNISKAFAKSSFQSSGTS